MALDLRNLDVGMPGITPALAQSMHEAAAVCLDHNSHVPGALLTINGAIQRTDALDWTPPNTQTINSWADMQEATEKGACGIAALLVRDLTSLTVVERARKKTGFDYWLGPKAVTTPLFQQKKRLEVSGILAAAGNSVNQRLNIKVNQVNAVPSPLDALIVIVDFRTPLGHIHIV